MAKIKDESMRNQQLQHGEFRVDSDPDGFKRKMQKRYNWMRYGLQEIFILVVIALGIVIYFAAK